MIPVKLLVSNDDSPSLEQVSPSPPEFPMSAAVPKPPPLPSHLVHHADQARALVDESVTKMTAEVRKDLLNVDPTALWWATAHVWMINNSKHELATALASAMLRLAQQPQAN
jgi:hypothetical protein